MAGHKSGVCRFVRRDGTLGDAMRLVLAIGVCVGAVVGVACGDSGADSGADASVSADAGAVVDSTPGPDTGPRPDADPTAIWRPPPGTSWQWQLSGTIDTSVDVDMYDIDLFEVSQGVIDALHGDGRIVVCYFSAGSREQWRPDADDIAVAARGEPLDGWDGEVWLDVRHASVRSVMRARLDLAVTKSCDGVEPDNVDGFVNDSGFPLTSADQLDFNRFLATEAHARGLSIGLKNDVDQIDDLVGDFDWALNEECFAFSECGTMTPFIGAGKAVFQVEYGNASLADTVCPQAALRGFDTLIKQLELDAWRVACD